VTNAGGETVPTQEISVPVSSGQNSVTLNWAANNGPNQGDTSPLGVVSYNIYRSTSSGQETLIANVPNGKISGDPPVSSWSDTVSTPIGGKPPYVYYPTGGTYNVYAAFLHQPSITAGGYAYGFPYDDQGGTSSNVQVNTPATATIALEPWTSSPSPSPSPSLPPSPSSSQSNSGLPANVAFLFLAENRFTLTVDSVVSQFSSAPPLIHAADQMVIVFNDLLHLDNPALGTGLDGLLAGINSNPYSGTLEGLIAQLIGLEMAVNLFAPQNPS
jgi:hypothetical protein